MDQEESENGSGGSEPETNSPTWWDPTAHGDTSYIVSGEIHGWDPAKLLEETSQAFQADVATARKQAAKAAAKLQQKIQGQRVPKSFGLTKHVAKHAARVGMCATLHLLVLLISWSLFGPWAGLLAMALLSTLTYTWLRKPGILSPGREEQKLAPLPEPSLSSIGDPTKDAPDASRYSPTPEDGAAVRPTGFKPPQVTDGPVVITPQGITSAGDLATMSQTLTGERFDGPRVLLTDEDGVSMFFTGTRGGYKAISVPGPGVLIKFARDGGMPTDKNITGYFYSLPYQAEIRTVKLIRDMLQPKKEVRFFGGYVSADPAGVNWKRYTVDAKDVVLRTKRVDDGITGEFHVGDRCIVAFRVDASGMLGNVRQIEQSNLEA